MISLLKFLDIPWERARTYLRLDLEAIQSALNQRWAATFGDTNILSPTAGGTGGATLTAHGLLVGEGTSPIVALTPATDGQLPIGKTGSNPVVAALTAGTGQTVVNGPGTITISPTPHALLDGVIDNDTLADTPVLGDVLIANATPKWARLPGQITSTQKFLSQTGDGSISAVPSWQTVPTAGSLVFFFYKLASDIATYNVMKTPASVGAAQTFVSAGLGNGNTLLVSFATLAGVPNLTFVPAGICTCYVTARTSSAGSQITQLFAQFYQRTSGGVETLLATSAITAQLTTSDAAYIFQGAIPSSVVFVASDRLVTKITASRSGGGSPTTTLTVEGVTAARSESPSATVDATNFVPYTGATANVDLGSKNLTTTGALTLPTIPLAATSGGTGIASYAIGDLLSADTTTTLSKVADVAVNSVLISKGISVLPAWSDSVNLGTTNSGFLNISGKLAVTFTLADDGVFAQTVSATFPSVITASRTALNYNITTAGSSAFAPTGLAITFNAGYTGSAQTVALKCITNVATTLNQSVSFLCQSIGAGLSNCAISGVSNNATNGNIGVYGGIGGFTEGNFNFNITAAILASSGATGNDIYRGYSSTTLKFSVTDGGAITQAGKTTKYNNINTVSGGMPAEYATIDTTGLTANVGVSTLYAVPASGAGMYRVSAYVVETTAGSLTSTLPNVQIVYTDNDTGGSITIDATPILGVAGIGQTGALTANTIGTASSGVIAVNVKASTTIQYQTVNYASNAAGMAYALHIKLEAL